ADAPPPSQIPLHQTCEGVCTTRFARSTDPFTSAVAVGFEPTVACATRHFECRTVGRSDTLPGRVRVPADAPGTKTTPCALANIPPPHHLGASPPWLTRWGQPGAAPEPPRRVVVIGASVAATGINELVDLLQGKRFTVLTGAGVSTDSGLPDYRGPNSPKRSPMTYDQFVGDPAFRRHYWARNHVGWHHMRSTETNEGHRALARLEARGLVTGVITQNVDLLHERAGSQRVIDLHGHYNEVICLNCGRTLSRTALDRMLTELNPNFTREVADVEIAPDADAVLESTEDFVVQDCPHCDGILKPNIVYFGENVPKERVAAA